jgi:pimeloyl-ACP methyl ester carboxylesterase
MKIEEFRIDFPQSVLDDLKQRLSRTRWPRTISGDDWRYGPQSEYLHELVDYWINEFDWRKEEKRLNGFRHFRMEIDGIRIHFIHQRSANKTAVPLILTHGWPGSFVEMLEILPLLQNDFHMVVPSLPGYGFSDAAPTEGMHPRKIASLWVRLMAGLGYDRFIAQGGDWGATVSSWLANDYPDNVAGIHLNYIPGSYLPFVENESSLSDAEKQFIRQENEWRQAEGAYSHLQSTKPLTVSYALNDSPAGLAAWILEKIRDWSDCKGNLETRFSKDTILTTIQIYWLTGTIYSSVRLYAEANKMPLQLLSGQRIGPPCAVARLPLEAPMPPREWVERGYNVKRWTEFPVGGHFAAWEEPQLFANDLREAAPLLWEVTAPAAGQPEQG